MSNAKQITFWAVLTGFISLLLGAVAVVLSDFGMPAWFFVLTQIWFWTMGLPTMVGVLLVTAAWGIPGWTALPLWAYATCAVVVAIAFQTGCFALVRFSWKRLAGRRP